MINLRLLKLSDGALWSAVALLALIGLLAIFSSTYSMQIKFGSDPLFFVKRQLLSLLVGMAGMALFAYLDFKHFKKGAYFLYFLMILLLGAVLVTGSSAQGAQRWFEIGNYSFQPSEVAKIVMVIFLAAFFSNQKKLKGFNFLSLFVMVGIPFLLIFKQPDLGTALVMMVIFMGMLAAAWSPSKVLILIIAIAIGVGIAFPYIWGMLKTYQQHRIIAFINPASDPKGAGYHSLQSLIAIGSGGLFGKGFMHGSQTQLQFIPEQHSDFVYSVVGEEFGFIGAAFVLFLFGIIIWRALDLAAKSDDPFASLLSLGIAVMIGFHIFANIGMTVGLLPVVGIPLPFMSFGGSSLLTNLVAVGILQSISMRRRKMFF